MKYVSGAWFVMLIFCNFQIISLWRATYNDYDWFYQLFDFLISKYTGARNVCFKELEQWESFPWSVISWLNHNGETCRRTEGPSLLWAAFITAPSQCSRYSPVFFASLPSLVFIILFLGQWSFSSLLAVPVVLPRSLPVLLYF